MIASTRRLFRLGMVAVDAVTIVGTYVLADVLRCHLWMQVEWPEKIAGISHSGPIHFWMLSVLPIAWPLLLGWHGWYELRWRSWLWLTVRVGSASAVAVLLMAALALLFQRELYPRAQLGFMAVLMPATTLTARSISGLIGQWWGAQHARHILIIGTDREAVRLRRLLRSIALGRSEVLGHLRLPGDPARSDRTGAVLGDIDKLSELLATRVIDEVVFSVPIDRLAEVLPYVALCEEIGVTAAVPARSAVCHTTPGVADYHGISMLTFGGPRHRPELLFVKRVLDVVVAGVALALLWPWMLLIAAALRLTSEGPALFRQTRCGLNGRVFTMYKFRTMVVGAEERRDAVAHLNEADGPVFKSRRDPRVTRVGAWLRKYSLDELPQLINVLRGDMAVVGPRPPLPAEVAKYDRWQRRRLSMRPGLTCLWQIKGRTHESFEEWMKLDLFYIDHWSLKLDALILGKTVVTVLSGSGA
ncbi:MAG: sugar transferase [Phycisphaerae bacterium]|nr:sugar transferase [Phycisphaerae bacterium]NUQ47372.1 sugar transferase [Phycisphaerae bacterium]